MLWIVDGGMINLPVVARVEDFKEDAYIEITGATENHEWKSEPTRYEKIVRCKDCKFYWKNNKSEQEPVCLVSPNDDAFCSEGKRKEKEDE